MNIDWNEAPQATHFDPQDRNFLMQFCGISLVWNRAKGWIDHCGQYPQNLRTLSRLIVRLEQGERTGEGLPPIGAHVCVYDPEGVLMYGAGEDGEVIAHIENTAVIRMSYGLGCFTAKHLRTPEQIATEERQREIDSAFSLVNTTTQVPGDFVRQNILRHAIETMIDAGYRKQVPQ